MLKRNLKRPKSVSSSSIAHSRLPHVMLTGVFVLCACWTLKAEPPETTEPPSANAGPADQPAARVAALPKRISSVSHEMFSLAPLSPWESVTPNDNGFVAVRVDELLKLPVAALALPSFVEPFLDKIWDVVSTDEASESRADLGLSVRNLELIVSSMTASVSQKPAQDGEGVSHQSTIQAGENGVDIRFVNAVSHDAISNSLDRDKITDWLVSAPQGKLSIKDQTHSEFVENALGMILTDGAVTKTLSTKKDEPIEFDEAALEKLKRGWKAIDGGILASTHSFPKTLGYVDESEDAAQEDLFNRTACAGVGIDSKDGRDFSLRVALIPRDEATAADVLATMEHLIDMAKQDEGAGSTPVEIAQTALAMEFFKTLNLTIVADPHAQESKFVLMEGKLPLQAVLLLADF